MNRFHVYEAIGRGKCSTVYKGRKKKTIEYYAIKSVDKSQKRKVLHEVKILHSLDHPNVLKFYSWYETSAHLWLVLEYCVGGDLRTLLQQDGQLPEESILDFATDLVTALQYLHSKGILYCDLKPSNILLDENGHLKLCDFGLANKLSDISKTYSTSTEAKCGTPCYMAPELFEDAGVHSYASDFWALGCVLYECYTGRPPFVGREFTQLVNSIVSDPTPPLPGNPSRPFANLINSLLVKDPAERIQWNELHEHAFWRSKFPLVSLPPQPAFDKMIGYSARPCLSERNADRPLQNKTPTKGRERDAKVTPRKDENSQSGLRGIETPVKGTPGSKRNQVKATSRPVEEKQNSAANRRINLLRLSRIAKSNLQRENEKENYRRPLPNGAENESEIKLENTDMELDFNENTEDETQDEPDGTDTDNSTGTPGKVDNVQQMDMSPVTNSPFLDETGKNELESVSDHVDTDDTPPTASPLPKHQKVNEDVGSEPEFDSSKSCKSISEVIWHTSDLSVRPVMPSRKADKTSGAPPPSLPFEALQPSDLLKMTKEQLHAVNSRIVSILNGSSSVSEKQNVIRYLEMLSSNADTANILTNGPVMLTLVKMLRLSKASALRVHLASLIGLLIRHATKIEDDLANSGILSSLTDSLRDRQEKVRRFSMAALGELLFYIATENDQSKDNNPSESPAKDGRSVPGWQVPNSLISMVSSVLRRGEDDITQVYALRTIENVCSQGGQWATRFTSQDVISNLCYIYRAPGKQESMRLTAGSCLVRLARFNPSSIQSVMEKLSFKEAAASIMKGNAREQQISLNLLSMAILGNQMFTNLGKHLLPLAEDKNLAPSLVSIAEQGSEILKGKALIFIALLCKNSRRWLTRFFCNERLLSSVDRLTKEKDGFLHDCLDAFLHILSLVVPSLLDSITGDIHQMIGGRRQGQISAAANRVASKTSIHYFPFVLRLLGSLSLKLRVVNNHVLQQLANLLKLMETPFQGRDDFQITLLQVLESVAEESQLILANPQIFTTATLPSLATLYKGNKDDHARFLCLKILFHVMVIFLNEPSEDEQRSEALKSIANVHFLPLYPMLVEDEDPIPIFSQKLLVMLIDFNYIKISDILHLKKTVSQCFEFLLGDLSTANVSNVKLCLALASAPEMESKLLSQLKVVRRIGNLLEFVHAKEMEDFLEPTLGLCKAFLLRSFSEKKGLNFRQQPSLLTGSSSEADGCLEGIRDVADFGSHVGLLLVLSGSSEANLSEISSECIVLLLKAAPREATAGFLTNLPKVSAILESWRSGVQHLIILRMLHALCYSCRQYRSYSMILSISMAEISKLQVLVVEMKSSAGAELSNAASLVASELQRLPRQH
ncbi:Serine/threonine-protein kinase RUNKEL [Linum grandiflorum]